MVAGNLEWSFDPSPEWSLPEHVMAQIRHFTGQNAKCTFEAGNSVSLPYFLGWKTKITGCEQSNGAKSPVPNPNLVGRLFMLDFETQHDFLKRIESASPMWWGKGISRLSCIQPLRRYLFLNIFVTFLETTFADYEQSKAWFKNLRKYIWWCRLQIEGSVFMRL